MAIARGLARIVTTGVPQPLPRQKLALPVTISTCPGNSADIRVGHDGAILRPQPPDSGVVSSVRLAVDDMGQIFITGAAGEGVSYLYGVP